MTDARYWPKEFLTEFIEEYKANPCLWQLKWKDYTNKNLKNVAYDKLVLLCKTVYYPANRDFVVKKIQSLRGSFRKELRKVTESMKSGKSLDDIYIPTLWYYDLLLFTKDQEMPAPSISIRVDKEVSNHEELDEDSNQPPYSPGSMDVEIHEYNNEKETEEIEKSESTTPNEKSTYFPPTRNKKRKMTAAKRTMEFRKTCTNALQKGNDVVINEYEAVGMNVGAKLSRMDPTQAIYAEYLINKVLTRGLLETLTHATDLHDKNVQVVEQVTTVGCLSNTSCYSNNAKPMPK